MCMPLSIFQKWLEIHATPFYHKNNSNFQIKNHCSNYLETESILLWLIIDEKHVHGIIFGDTRTLSLTTTFLNYFYSGFCKNAKYRTNLHFFVPISRKSNCEKQIAKSDLFSNSMCSLIYEERKLNKV